jgi:hypothetical protein
VIVFSGNYAFTDVNKNNVPDAWEQQFFGRLLAGNPAMTDSDGDGMSDYAEFIAGTDPTNAASRLTVSLPAPLPAGGFRLDCFTVPGRAYRLLGSADLAHWAPLSDWAPAAGARATFTLPPPAPGAPFLFRIEVRP